MPPKQKPMAAMPPSLTSGCSESAFKPVSARRTRNAGSSRKAVRQAMIRSRSPATPSPYMSQGEHGVTEFRVAASLVPRVHIESGAAVNEQDSGFSAGQRVVPVQYTGQRGVQIAVVQVTGRQGERTVRKMFVVITQHGGKAKNPSC
jgi:hypothetical protein